MATRRASVELLATLDDAWRYVSEPYHFPDWWPPVATVRPDRRGLAAGARWTVRSREASLFRGPEAEDVLVVHEVEPPHRLRFEIVRARVRADLSLAAVGDERTRATLTVSEPFRLSFTRGRLAHDALARLYDLVQTAAS
ncbi:MAG: hypothetical protein KatS3mg012_1590 [Gaiellaceae bacterium]|nr:MAG: hypothetical protein KatS3mg012_1590 [Gaiellaceae bacterium]